MKGFIYLLEISVAMILILVVLGTLSSFESKENWERNDLIKLANYMSNNIDSSDIAKFLVNNTSKIEILSPKNIDYGLEVSGVAKSNISVGCVEYCGYIKNLLTPSYVNGRWVNFSVQQFDLETLNYIPPFDAVVFVNYTRYNIRKANITNYINRGGVVIGINATFSNNDPDFNGIFGTSPTGSGGGSSKFSKYEPSEDETEKYFLGIGFDINTSNTIGSKKWGYWYVWDSSRSVNITSSTVDIENKSADEGMIKNVPEGGIFGIKSPVDNLFYSFRVKKIFWDSYVVLQPLNSSFIFRDFSESNDVKGKFDILSFSGGQAQMASNGSTVWISDFPMSDEYRTLVKAAISSRTKNYEARRLDSTKKYIALSSFYPICCDVPETAKLTLYLWYRI